MVSRIRLVFSNPKTRGLLLWLVGIEVGATYLWSSLVSPFIFRPRFEDFSVFFKGASDLKGGLDPYLPILGHGRYDFSFQSYIYAPIVAWVVQPLLGLGLENAALVALVVLQVCVFAFFGILYSALRPVSRHEVAFGVILALSFGPLYANLWNDQVNLVLLSLGALVLLAYCQGDHWWGGAAYGLAMALKPLQPVVGLLLVWGHRWRMLVGAILAGIAALAISGPALSVEFVTKVLPVVAGGTGFRANAAPAGLLERLFHPAAFADGTAPGGIEVRLLYWVVVVTVVFVTWWRLGRVRRTEPLGRASEVATAMAASPLLLEISNTWHLVLLLIPILILLRVALARKDGWLLLATLVAWFLMGPAYNGMLSALGAGWFSPSIDSNPVFRVWNECQLLGMVILWLGCLRALGSANTRSAQLRSNPLVEPVG